MVDKKTSQDYFNDWLSTADPVIKSQFPDEETILKVAKTLSNVRFRTRYNCFINDCEHPDPVSVVERGRSESLDHLVQRLTGRPNPTMRDITKLALANGEFEDPTELSDSEIDARMERVVALGDNIDAVEALYNLNQQKAADEPGVLDEQVRTTAEDERAKKGDSESSNAAQNGAEKSA